jgi:hypothetical protein
MSYKPYWSNWSNRDDIIKDFFPSGSWYKQEPVPEDFPTNDKILFAAYEGGSYEGAAIVVYEKDGKLYEVNGGHCSCSGLEEQWSPEETSVGALKMRKLNKYDYCPETIGAFQELLKWLDERSSTVQDSEQAGQAGWMDQKS